MDRPVIDSNYPSGNHDLLFKELGILSDAKILDVGGGANPFKYANVVVDMDFNFGNIHRDGSALCIKKDGVTYIQADIHSLPFKDNAFDFVVSMQVLEHVDYPDKACDELMRVAKAGFLEVPRKWTEYYAGHPSHRWLIDFSDDYLTFEPITYNESPFLNFALPVLWDSSELQKRVALDFVNIPSIQVVWGESGFRYKVENSLTQNLNQREFLAESHYCFAKNILFWVGEFETGAFHAESAFKISPQNDKYKKLYLFYSSLKSKKDINLLTGKLNFKLILAGLLCRSLRFINIQAIKLFRKIVAFFI
ncbi:MAG: class I SAM-dependent methyltransferase [Desulfamplus sp.]|nr:class I SAM-dependent methyltransferase [Desulfamplus sp.]